MYSVWTANFYYFGFKKFLQLKTFQTGAVLQAAGAGAAESAEEAPWSGDQGTRGRHQETAGENPTAQGETWQAKQALIPWKFLLVIWINIILHSLLNY